MSGLKEPLLDKEHAKFSVSAQRLSDLFLQSNVTSGESVKIFNDELGGMQGLLSKLDSSEQGGIKGDSHDRSRRKHHFGKNKPKVIPPKSFCLLVWETMEDFTLRILIVAALISLVIGTYENPSTGWMEGVAILIAITIVVLVTAINDWLKERQFQKLNSEATDRNVTVIRDGKTIGVSYKKALVGDILTIQTGDVIPVDGIVLYSNSLACNESSVTGEPEPIKKTWEIANRANPFVLSGSQVEQGTGTMVVCCVGPFSYEGKNREAILDNVQDGETALQEKLNRIAAGIGKVGLVMAVLTFLVLVIYMIIDIVDVGQWQSVHTQQLINSFITGVTILVVAVPEGLPLAVTLSLAYSVNKMKQQKNLVRHLDACEVMGGATNICTDKTGTLTENIMTVVKLWTVGQEYNAVELKKDDLDDAVRELLVDHMCNNSTAEVEVKDGKTEFGGSRSECALLQFSENLGTNYHSKREKQRIVKMLPFSSDLKLMGVCLKYNDDFNIIYVKGASERVLDKCEHYLGSNGNQHPLDEEIKVSAIDAIGAYADQANRTLTLGYKLVQNDFQLVDDNGDLIPEQFTNGLILQGVVAIRDPIRKNVPDAVKTCQNAGITVRMVTGDNIRTAQAIARECGILRQGYVHSEESLAVMEGPDFMRQIGGFVKKVKPDGKEYREVSNMEEFKKIIRELRVMARSEPDHKEALVTGLKQIGEVVAVTGDGTNDAPALTKANVGFAMNIAGTQLAKEASDIILLDDNFASTVTAVKWGRNIYDCIRKFIQFQVTVNLVALTLAFIGACILQQSPLTAVQMLWVNLIMDTFAALALATEPPNDSLLKRKPYSPNESLITTEMFKMILGYALYQIIWLFIILFLGERIFDFQSGRDVLPEDWTPETGRHFTFFFNAFVFMQVFNEINCRKLLSTEYNVFAGFFNNPLFLLIILVTIVVQIILVTFGGQIFKCSQLTLVEHAYCLAIGAGGILWGLFIRALPNKCLSFMKFSEEPMNAMQVKTSVTGFIRKAVISRGITGALARKQ